MIEKTISDIEGKIRGAETFGDAHKTELLGLLGKLKSEVNSLAQTHGAEAQSIADSVHASAKAASEKSDSASLENSAAGLRSSVEGFEQSHPQLVQVVNSISNVLSNSGI